MADEIKKISELQSVVSLDGSEVLPIVQSGVTKKVTVEQILDEVDSYTKSEADTLLLNKVDKVSGKGLSTNDLTNELLTLLSTKKVKNITTDAVNDRLVITYTDDTTSNLNINDIVTDVNVTGATLDATTNVLTLTSDDGGADVTVNLSDFVNSSELTSALSLKEDTSNKKTDLEANKTSDTFFPSIKAVYDWAKGIFVSKVVSTDDAIVAFVGTTGEVKNTNLTKTALDTYIGKSGMNRVATDLKTIGSNTINWAGGIVPTVTIGMSTVTGLIGAVAGTWNKIGDSTTLLTTAKTTIVGAINELFNGKVDNSKFLTSNLSNPILNGGDGTTINAIGYVQDMNELDISDGALFGQAYSSECQYQIFGDYITGRLASRGKHNNTWTDWVEIARISNLTTGLSTKFDKTGGTITGVVSLSTGEVDSHFDLVANINQWKYLRLQSGSTIQWDIATKDDDVSGALQFRQAGSSSKMNIMKTGEVRKPFQPIISGQIGSAVANPVSPLVLPFNEFWVNQGGIAYNTTTKRFTVPVAGVYRITFNPFFINGQGGSRVFIGVNTDAPTPSTHRGHSYRESATYDTGCLNSIVSLNANDYIVFYLHTGGLYNQSSDKFNQFTIELIA